MAKRKPEEPIEHPSRRRRTLRTRKQRRDQPVMDKYVNRAADYARHYTAAAIMAAIARRLGHPSVSPRDFYCGCPPCYRDGLPMCARRRSDCRFANRPEPEVLARRETAHDQWKYDFLWEGATLAYRGPTLPRALWGRRAKRVGDKWTKLDSRRRY